MEPYLGNPTYTKAVLRSHGIGMKYAIERLKAMVDGAVRVDSEADKGTTVTIEIPKKTKERDE